ncbi:hypothetical protein BO78DRAFT_388888 [Aspergillus sclerotiicarbonarius CBS 121057]|uniref:Nephrocystin 3-like N-terminal domain-containing protein n=1 Tax=Aspergillus sclerotiicarbonarius (strain CBS 121057 / IBT 28362) TaxID=1448318 RepID=A0A319E3H7_ASPSB|nr:hypothetical protein BO78DRAFT_388888 [Aspergillus sclerotiicarbonarius CBS 121057]
MLGVWNDAPRGDHPQDVSTKPDEGEHPETGFSDNLRVNQQDNDATHDTHSIPDDNHLQSDSDLQDSSPRHELSSSSYHERTTSDDDTSSIIIDEPSTPEAFRTVRPAQYKPEGEIAYSSQYELHETLHDSRKVDILTRGARFESKPEHGNRSVDRQTVSFPFPPTFNPTKGIDPPVEALKLPGSPGYDIAATRDMPPSPDSPTWRPQPATFATGRMASGLAKAYRPGRGARPATPPARIPRLGAQGSPSDFGRPLVGPGNLLPGDGGRFNLTSYVQATRPHFVAALPGGLPSKATTLKEVQRKMDNLRLKLMPHRASRTDRILHRADGLAEVVDAFISTLRAADPAVAEGSNLVMASFMYLIYLISKRPNSVPLEQAFTVLDQMAVVLYHITQHMGFSTPEISPVAILALIEVLNVNLDIVQALKSEPISPASLAFRPRFETRLKRLLEVEEMFSLKVWRGAIERSSLGSGDTGVDIIRKWLSHEEMTGPAIKFPELSATTSPDTELPLKWLSDLTTKFWQSNKSMLFIMGDAGTGKSAFSVSILDRSKARYSRGAKILYFSVEPSLHGRRTSTDLVKSLLLQLFERAIGDAAFFQSLRDVYGAVSDDCEHRLWSILQQQAISLSFKYPCEELLLVIDGLDKIEGDQGQVCTWLHGVVKQRPLHRCIILSRLLVDGDYRADCLDFEIAPNVLREDIRHLVRTRVQKMALLKRNEKEARVVIERALQCPLDSLVTAHFLVALIELQRSYREVTLVLRSIPSTLSGWIDLMITQVRFEEPQVKHIMSWLLVAGRAMTRREMEIMIDPHFAVGSLGPNAPQFFRKSCASLIEIRGGSVRFLHPLIKQRLIQLGRESTILFGHRAAHRVALSRCLEYIQSRLPDDDKTRLTLDESGSLDNQTLARVADDSLLEYSILHYIEHYEESHPDNSAEFGGVYRDSPLLAQLERHYWRLHASDASLEHKHLQALDLRKAVLGGRSLSVVQTLITLSMLANASGHLANAIAYLGEAWCLATRLPDKDEHFCRELAWKYSTLCISDTTSKLQVDVELLCEELFEFLWDLEQKRSNQLGENAVLQVEALLQIYQHRNKHDQMAGLHRQLYEKSIVSFGKLDNRTICYANRLLEVLGTLDCHHEVGRLCEELLMDMGDEINVWDHRRLDIIFRLTEWYDSQGRQHQAEEKLRNAWQALYRVTIDKKSPEARLAFVQMSLRLGKSFITGSNPPNASEVALKLWEALDKDTSSLDETTLRELLTLSDCYIQAGILEPVIPILVELTSVYHDRLSIDAYVEAVQVSILLSKCYRHHPGRGDGTGLLQKLVEDLLSMDIVDEHCIDVVAELVEHHQDRYTAVPICHQVLERVWPELRRWEYHESMVPDVPSDSGFRMGLVYARLVVSQNSKDEAAGVLRFLFTSLRHSDRAGDLYVFDAAELYSDVLRDAGRIPEAIDVVQSLQTKFHGSYGAHHEQYTRIAGKLVDRFQVTDIRDVSEEILVEFIEGFGHGEGLCQSSCLNAVHVLIKVYETKDRPIEMRAWYERLRGAMALYRGSGDITEDQIFAVLQEYSGFLLAHHQRAEAIQIIRELRMLVSRGGILPIQVDYELALLLEKDHQYGEAVGLYEGICQRDLHMSGDQHRILTFMALATDRLSCLYAQHSSLASKAEEMLRRAWETAKRIKGCSDEHTINCFHKLMDFYGQDDSRTANACARLEGYIVQIMTEELDEERLFAWAYSFSQLYTQFGAVNAGLQLLHDLRAERALLMYSTEVPARRIGEARLLLVDRRSFVLVNTLEALLMGRPQVPVLRDIMQEVLTESALYEAWTNIKRVRSSLQTGLTVSSRLRVFLQDRGRKCEADALLQETWALFQMHSQQDLSQSGVIWAFFTDCLHELHKRQPSIVFVTSLVDVCIELHRRQCFAGCLPLSEWAREYLMLGGWGSQTKEITGLGFRLVQTIRSGESAAMSPIPGALKKLTEDIIIGLVYRGRGDQVDLTGLSLGEVNIVIRFLSDKNDIDCLEQIFQSLWNARILLDNWHLSTTVSIGLRLCEAKFARGRTSEAHELIGDMLYNLHDVYDEFDHFHPLIIRCENLRASFHNRQGQHSLALEVHHDLLTQAVGRHHSHRSEDALLASAASESWGDIMLEQARSLKATYELNAGWDLHGAEYYMGTLEEAFELGSSSAGREHWHSLGRPSTWQPVCPIPKATRGQFDITGLTGEDVVALWVAPRNWTIPEDEAEESAGELLEPTADEEDRSWQQ